MYSPATVCRPWVTRPRLCSMIWAVSRLARSRLGGHVVGHGLEVEGEVVPVFCTMSASSATCWRIWSAEVTLARSTVRVMSWWTAVSVSIALRTVCVMSASMSSTERPKSTVSLESVAEAWLHLVDLDGELAREVADLAHHAGGHVLHVRGLHADLGARRIGALGHVVHGAHDVARNIAQAAFEAAQRILGGGHDAVEVLGAVLEAGDQRVGVVADEQGGLVEGRALVLDSGDEAADPLLVAAEGALDGGDFLVDDFLQHGGALHGVFHAADQQVDFGADRLGNGGEAFGGDVLRAHEAHGGLEQGFRHLAHVGGAPQRIGGRPHHDDRNEEQRHRLELAVDRRIRAERAGIGEEPAARPQCGEDDGDEAIGREGGTAAQPRQHHGRAGIVLVGGAALHRRRLSQRLGRPRWPLLRPGDGRNGASR